MKKKVVEEAMCIFVQCAYIYTQKMGFPFGENPELAAFDKLMNRQPLDLDR